MLQIRILSRFFFLLNNFYAAVITFLNSNVFKKTNPNKSFSNGGIVTACNSEHLRNPPQREFLVNQKVVTNPYEHPLQVLRNEIHDVDTALFVLQN